jgi:hypothetical protein
MRPHFKSDVSLVALEIVTNSPQAFAKVGRLLDKWPLGLPALCCGDRHEVCCGMGILRCCQCSLTHINKGHLRPTLLCPSSVHTHRREFRIDIRHNSGRRYCGRLRAFLRLPMLATDEHQGSWSSFIELAPPPHAIAVKA